MEYDFTIISTNNTYNTNYPQFTEFYEKDGDFYIYTLFYNDKEKYIIANTKGQKVVLMFFKLNGFYYININKYITIDLKRFIHIEYLVESDNKNSIEINGKYSGVLILQNCDINLAHKMLWFIDQWYLKNCNWWYNVKYNMNNY